MTRIAELEKALERISIHTPAQGVTVLVGVPEQPLGISIHTPAQGVTLVLIMLLPPMCHFNPHSRTGSDAALELV